jgi:murein DD-endopeptidase MepM/ murein hydrolase activator NlpD
LVVLVTAGSLLAPSLAGAQDDGTAGGAAGPQGGSAQQEYLHTLQEEQQVRDAQQAAQERADELGRQIADLDAHLAEVQQELDAAQAELDQKQAALDETEASLADVEARLATEQQRLRNQAIEAYVGGGATPVPDFAAALKNAASLEDVAKSQVYAEAVVVDRKAVVQRVGELRSQADQLRSTADNDRQTAADARDEVAGRRDDLERTRAQQADAQAAAVATAAEQQRLAAEIETRRRADELAYAQEVSSSDSIAQMLARWQKDQQPAAETFGIFLDPIKNGKIVSGYGPRLHPIYGVVRQHNGLDLDGQMGEQMRASENGLVLVASEQGGYGLTVVIDHGNQLATLYGHMSRLDVKPGDLVQRGQQIGLVGSTGVSTGPHCHWEVRVLGLPVDGTPYLNTTPEP